MEKFESKRHGSCLCGDIKIELRGEPIRKVLCHCLSCQKSSGAAYEANVFYRMSDTQVLDPKSVIRTYLDKSSDSGFWPERSFCGNCGSHVHTTNPKNPWVTDVRIVPIGVLDGDRSDLKPNAEFYTKRRLDWVDGIESADQFQGMT